MEPLQELYNNLSKAGQLPGVSFEKFSAKLQDPAEQDGFYQDLANEKVSGSEYGMAGLPKDQFFERFFTKKKVSGDASPSTSFEAPASAPTAAQKSTSDDFLAGLDLTKPAVQPSAVEQPSSDPDALPGNLIPKPATQDVLTAAPVVDKGEPVPYNITGDEEILEYAKSKPHGVNEKIEEGKGSVETGFTSGVEYPEAKAAILYGEDAHRQTAISKDFLEQEYGPNWKENPKALQSPNYEKYQAGIKGQAKAYDTYQAVTGGFTLTGEEDPASFGEQRRMNLPSYNYKKTYSEQNPVRKENRVLENIAEYGEAAVSQERFADSLLKQKYGENWKRDVVEMTMMDALDPESQKFYETITSDEDFKRWQGASKSQNKGYAEFKKTMDSSPALQKQMLSQKKAQQESNVASILRPGPEVLDFLQKPVGTTQPDLTQNWLWRKGSQLVAGALALPRTVGSGLGSDDGQWRPADWLGSIGDEIVEQAEVKYPKPESLKGALYQRYAEFEGHKVAVDAKGNLIKSATELPEGYEQRFKDKNAGANAKTEFAGGIAVTDKVLDSAADLFLYRFMGGGTKLGTVASSFYMQHQQAYKEAVEQQQMGADDAAQYAFVTATLQGVLEAYMGTIESKIAKPAVAEAIALGKKEALAAAGKMSAGRRALIALKPVFKETAGENAEEFGQGVQDYMTRAYYNQKTGADLANKGMSKESMKETALVATLLTAPLTALGMGGYTDSYRRSALLSAARNSPRFQKLMEEMQEAGGITSTEAQQAIAKVERLAAFNNNLPDNIGDDERSHILALQEYRDAQNAIATNDAVLPAQQSLAKAEVKTSDEVAQGILTEVPAEPTVKGTVPPTISKPKKSTIKTEAVDLTDPETTVSELQSNVLGQTIAEDLAVAAEDSLDRKGVTVTEAVKQELQETIIPEILAGNPDIHPAAAIDQATDEMIDQQESPEFAWSNKKISNGAFDEIKDSHKIKIASNGIRKTYEWATSDGKFEIKWTDPIGRSSGYYTAYLNGRPIGTTTEYSVALGNTSAYLKSIERRKPRFEVKIETPTDVLNAHLAEGGKINESDAETLPAATQEYFSPGGETIDDLAVQAAKQIGVTKEEAKAEIVANIKANPAPTHGKQLKVRELQQAGIPEHEIQDVIEGEVAAAEKVAQLSPEDFQAAEQFVADIDGDPDRIIAIVDGVATEMDLARFEELKKTNPSVHQLFLDNEIDDIPERNESAPQVGRSADQASTAPTKNTPQKEERGPDQGESDPVKRLKTQLATAKEFAESDHGLGDLPGKIVAATQDVIRKHMSAKLSGAKVDKIEVEKSQAKLDALRGKLAEVSETAKDDELEEIATVSDNHEAVEYSDEQHDIQALPAPVVTESRGKIYITAPGAEDALRQAGGVFKPGKGWEFPIAKKERALLAASRVRSITPKEIQDNSKGGFGGRVSVNMNTTQGRSATSAINREIASAGNTLSRVAAAKNALHIQDEERVNRVKRSVERMKAAFPGIEVIMDAAEVASALKSMGVDASVKGFVKDGKVYIDLDNAGIDTPMHEFGHIWVELMAVNKPDVYSRGIAAVRGSEYEATVREDTRYGALDDEGVLKEALARAIGERGGLFQEEGPWATFKAALSNIKRAVKSVLGFDPMKMSANEFADYVAAKLIKGGEVMEETSEDIARIQKQAEFLFAGEDLSPAKEDLEGARVMEKQGHSPKEVWAATNWYRGVDGMWRWEIADKDAKVFVHPDAIEDGTGMYLNEVMYHPELFNLFPEIGNLPVYFFDLPDDPGSAYVAMGKNGLYMVVNKHEARASKMKNTILHEVQHVVQAKEGFATGLSSNTAQVTEVLKENLAQAVVNQDIARFNSLKSEVGRTADDIYTRTAGEVESRLVESRSKGSTEFPIDQMDVAPNEQVVLFGSLSPQASLPGFEDTDVGKGAQFQHGSNVIRQNAITSAARTLIDIEVREGGDPTVFIPLIATELGLDPLAVDALYRESASKYAKRNQWLDLRDGKIPDTLEKMKKKWRRRWDRWIGPNKGLPPAIFREAQKIDREVSADMYMAGKVANDLQKVLKGYGPDMRELVQRALEGNADWSLLPPDVAQAAQVMRGAIDKLSRSLLLSGAVRKGTILTILENMGIEIGEDTTGVDYIEEVLSKPPFHRTPEEQADAEAFLDQHRQAFGTYLNRSYKKNTYDDWKDRVSPEVVDRARRYFVTELQRKYKDMVDKLSADEAAADRKIEKLAAKVAGALNLVDSMIDADASQWPGESTEDFAKRLALAGIMKNDIKNMMTEVAAMIGVTPSQITASIPTDLGSDVASIIAQARTMATDIGKIQTKMEDKGRVSGQKLDEISATLANIDDEINYILRDKGSAGGGLIGGSKNLSVLMQRKDIAPEIRELLGEYRDPVVNFMTSVMKASNLLHTQEFLNTMASKYEGIYFFESKIKPPGNYLQISANNDPRLAPLDGWWTSPDIIESLRDMRDPEILTWPERTWAMQVVQRVKLGKTVLSPGTHARNFFGNTAFMVMNGWTPGTMLKAVKELKPLSDTPQWRAYAQRLHQLGVFGESISAADLDAIRKFSSWDIDESDMGASAKVMSKLLHPAKTVYKGVKFAYEVEDNFYRMLGFENEKKRYARAWFGLPIDQLTPEQRDQVERRAAYIVSHVLPTYSYVGKLVRSIRRIPLTGTFVAFPAEIFRIGYNNIQLGIEEMRDTRTKGMGFKRLAGSATIMLALETGLIAGAKALFGYDDDEWEDAHKFVSPFERNGALIPLKKDSNGLMSYVNLSYTNPYSMIGKTARAFMNDPDKPIAGKVASSMYQMVEPFVSPELSFNAFNHLFMNQDDWSNKLRSDAFEDPLFGTHWLAGENVKKQFSYIAKKLQPGVVRSIRDGYDIYHKNTSASGKVNTWSNFLLSNLAGLSVQRIDPTFSYASQMYGLYDQKTDAKKSYSALQKRLNTAFTANQWTMTPQGIEAKDKEANQRLKEQYQVAKTAYARILTDAIELTQALRRLGVKESQIKNSIGESWSAEEKKAILSGNPNIPLTFKRKGRY